MITCGAQHLSGPIQLERFGGAICTFTEAPRSPRPSKCIAKFYDNFKPSSKSDVRTYKYRSNAWDTAQASKLSATSFSPFQMHYADGDSGIRLFVFRY